MVLTDKDCEASEIMPCKLTCKPAMGSWMMVQTVILLSKTQKNLLLRPILLTKVSAHSCTGSQSPRVPTGWQEKGQITSAQALVCMTGVEPWIFHTFHHMCVLIRVRLFCNPMDCCLPGSSVHGISQARILEWVAISFSRGSFRRRDWTLVSCISCTAGRSFTSWATGASRIFHNWQQINLFFCPRK